MSEKPQATREEEQEDLLEQIFTQGLAKMNAPAQAAVADETPPEEAPAAPKRESAGKDSPPADWKSKRTAVYLYLLILFGAAFLMLLLSYFIQQRSSENAISDLQESMNLSREELLDQINALQEEKEALENQNLRLIDEYNRLAGELNHLQTRFEQIDDELTYVSNAYEDIRERVLSWHSFWALERYYQAGDCESCAALLILQTMGEYRYRTPDAARQEEIVQAVIDAGILSEDYERHPADYNELLDAYFLNETLYGAEGYDGPTDWANLDYG